MRLRSQSFVLLLFSLFARIPSSSMFTLTSPAFANNSPIPSLYSRCDGDDISPPLEWTGVPSSAKSLALVVDDPDAPNPAAPKMTWVHWVLYNIPSTTMKLEQDISSSLPAGTMQAKNDWKVMGYGGPSPPIGTHRYFFKLYALDTVLPDLGAAANKASVVKAMKGHVIAEAHLIGTYKKGGNNDS